MMCSILSLKKEIFLNNHNDNTYRAPDGALYVVTMVVLRLFFLFVYLKYSHG